MSASPLSSSHSSASGHPALMPPPVAGYRRILILSGPYAQHVGTVTGRYAHGRVKAVVDYGHSPGAAGKETHLNSGDYVGTESPTCPALPRRQ